MWAPGNATHGKHIKGQVPEEVHRDKVSTLEKIYC
jgi:hypothetical protein